EIVRYASSDTCVFEVYRLSQERLKKYLPYPLFNPSVINGCCRGGTPPPVSSCRDIFRIEIAGADVVLGVCKEIVFPDGKAATTLPDKKADFIAGYYIFLENAIAEI